MLGTALFQRAGSMGAANDDGARIRPDLLAESIVSTSPGTRGGSRLPEGHRQGRPSGLELPQVLGEVRVHQPARSLLHQPACSVTATNRPPSMECPSSRATWSPSTANPSEREARPSASASRFAPPAQFLRACPSELVALKYATRAFVSGTLHARSSFPAQPRVQPVPEAGRLNEVRLARVLSWPLMRWLKRG